MDDLLDVNQAAEYLGVTPGRVRHYCQEGRLGVKVGFYWVITRSDLERFAAIPRRVGKPRKEGESETHQDAG